LEFEAVEVAPESRQTVIRVKAQQEARRCPICQRESQRLHSHYVRTLRDLPWADFSVVIILESGKWFCQNPSCERRIFTERLPGIAVPWARRTQRLAEVQTELGLTVGGRAGACLSTLLCSLVSRDTLIRLVRRRSIESATTPRVLGIDDWAKRKGQSYGTILVDLETHRVVEVLPERSAECVEQWLKAHPGVEIISRDRAGEYAAGASAGAPDATQVADRFHLLKNLGDALTEALKQHSRELRTISLKLKAVSETSRDQIVVNEPVSAEPPSSTVWPGTDRQKISQQKRARRLALYQRVCELSSQGWMQKTIAAELNLSAKTVSRWLAAHSFPERLPRSYEHLIDPYKAYLLKRWQEGCRNGAQLRREIEARGYQGGTTVVGDFIARLRRNTGLPASSHALAPGLDPQPTVLTPRGLTAILFKPAADRTEEQAELLEQVKEQMLDIQPALQLVEEFIDLVRHRLSTALDDWLMRAAQIPALRCFVNGIRRDYAAVYAALSTQWSNGQVEGQVNRLKFIKRQGYGRAKFDLLRRRVLLAGA
jgi:transposase